MKRKLLFLLVAVILGVMFASGCQKRPDKEIAEAEKALEAAKEAGAPQYAPKEFKSAEDMMAETYKLVDAKKYKDAREAAITTKELADVARMKALQRKQELEKEQRNKQQMKQKESYPGTATLAPGAVTGEALNEEIQQSKVGTGALGEGVTITKLPPIHFDFDKYNIREQDKKILQQIADWLKKHPTVRIRIEGHTDERGTEEYNMALGEKRAKAARDYLIMLGIDPSRIEIVSFGEEDPVDPRHNEEAWAKNRRDEFVIIKK